MPNIALVAVRESLNANDLSSALGGVCVSTNFLHEEKDNNSTAKSDAWYIAILIDFMFPVLECDIDTSGN